MSLPGQSGTSEANVKLAARKKTVQDQPKSTFPASFSIDALLKAGKLVKPEPNKKVTLCFSYNKCLYTVYDGQPSTIEEFVPGAFVKLIDNDGRYLEPPDDSSKELYAKAQCLVHFSYEATKEKLMLLDIQGSGYTLHDPEMSSVELTDGDSDEINFCCGNCSTYGIETFLESHICNEFCKLMDLKNNTMST